MNGPGPDHDQHHDRDHHHNHKHDYLIKIKCKKITFNASSNPKDIGPFPEYTLWYNENDELMKFKFKNWKDKKIVTIIRSN